MSSPLPLLVVGSVALDTVHTPAGERHEALGGSASYFALAAIRYAPVRMVAVAGDDFPAAYEQLFRDQGIDLEGLQISPGRTFRWGGRYTDDMNGRVTLFTELNVFESFHPALPERYRRTPVVLLANIAPALQLEVVRQIESPQLVALDTMNYWIESSAEDLVRVLEHTQIFFLNDEEARLFTGKINVLQAAREIQRMGPSLVVIKRGEHGVLCLTPGGWFTLPAFPVEDVRDPTGAGDSFAGGALGYLASRGGSLDDSCVRQALAHGTAVASHTVHHFGVEGLTGLTASAIRKRVHEVREVCRFDLDP
jgi:sugar/nucleoside kinase (ribokinase family)